MIKSFFGGDTSLAHYSCSVPFTGGRTNTPERRAAYAKIKEAFPGREKVFQFSVNDPAAKAKAKADCEAHAADILAKAGVVVEVCEGCFL